MKRRKPVFTMFSYGEYETWDRNSKKIPKIRNIGTEIKAETGTEFGYVLRIKNGKGTMLSFKIDHPPFTGETGKVVPPFKGEQFIRTNDYEFYLGDCVWDPPENKMGIWELTTYFEGKVVAFKKFILTPKKN
jgi:hypothetical protein